MKTKNMIWVYPIIFIGFVLFLLNSCKKEERSVITTAIVSNITATTAISGGNMTSDEASTVTACGVCWSKGTMPTVTDDKTSDINNIVLGTFSSYITGLNGSTTYFVRAYATNNAGTVYGKAISFTTLVDQEKLEIQNYLNNNPNLTFQLKPSGLYYLDLVRGTGDPAAVHDTARVMYNAYYLSGTKFSTNYGTTDTLVFPVGEGHLIAGFDEAITYMRAGGKSKILTPSYLAYGSSGYFMPAYTPLLFDIYLVRLEKGPK